MPHDDASDPSARPPSHPRRKKSRRLLGCGVLVVLLLIVALAIVVVDPEKRIVYSVGNDFQDAGGGPLEHELDISFDFDKEPTYALPGSRGL